MSNALDFADAVGRKNIADALGVGLTAVSNAVTRGRFPSSWFMACKGLADQAGVDCPSDLFGMRVVVEKPPAAPSTQQAAE